MTVIPNIAGALVTVAKGLEVLVIGGRIETIHITELLISVRILRRVLEM